jgi:FMN reductase
VVFASPTYKATYTALLKLFLEQFAAGELHGTTAVALMLGAAPHHALAGELTLKPVLSEIGCSCPTPALFLLESAWDAGPELDAWVERARDVLRIEPRDDRAPPT